MTGRVVQSAGSLEDLRQQARWVAEQQGLLQEPMTVEVAVESNGAPVQINGAREVMIEATFQDQRGHAFVHDPVPFSGPLADLLGLPLDSDQSRALVLAGAKAVLRYAEQHMRPEADRVTLCAEEIAESIGREFGRANVGIIGYEPTVIEACADLVGEDRVRVADPSADNIGRVRHGVEVLELEQARESLFQWSHVVIITGASGERHMAAQWLELADQHGTAAILYSTTGSGRAYYEGLRRAQNRANNDAPTDD